MTVGAELPQVGRRLFGRAEGNQVAEPLIDRQQAHAMAVRLRVMGPVQLLVPESTDEEMAIIHEGIFDTCVREIRGQLRLPHSLRKPQAGRLHTEAPLQVLAHAADLLEPIGAGQRRQDRLVESREQQLQPAIGGQPANHVEPRRVVLFEPLEQRT